MVKIAKKAKDKSHPTRKDMKQPDQFVEVGTKGLELANRYSYPIAIGFGAAIAISFVGFLIVHFSQEKQRSATEALGEALATYEAKIVKPEQNNVQVKNENNEDLKTFPTRKARAQAAQKAFEQLQKKYPNSQAANFANLYLGHIAQERNQLKSAIAHYERYLKKQSTQDPLAFLGIDALAKALEKHKKAAEGISKLKRYAKKGKNTFRPFSIQQIAQYYEQKGDLKQATRYYKMLQKEKNKSLQKEAEKRLTMLTLQQRMASPSNPKASQNTKSPSENRTPTKVRVHPTIPEPTQQRTPAPRKTQEKPHKAPKAPEDSSQPPTTAPAAKVQK
ncbi:MAG: hypothetical protein AAGJ35_03990 [Myxococcota bacterium]